MPSLLRRRSTKRAASSMASACSWHERAVRGAVDHHEGHDTAPPSDGLGGAAEIAPPARSSARRAPGPLALATGAATRWLTPAAPPARGRRGRPRRRLDAGPARPSPTPTRRCGPPPSGRSSGSARSTAGRPRGRAGRPRRRRCGGGPSRRARPGPATSRRRSSPALGDDDATIVEVAAWASGEREPPEPGAVAVLARLVDGPRRRPGARGGGRRARRHRRRGRAAGDPRRARATRPPCAAGRCSRSPRSRAPTSTPPWPRPASDRDWQVRQAAEDLSG